MKNSAQIFAIAAESLDDITAKLKTMQKSQHTSLIPSAPHRRERKDWL